MPGCVTRRVETMSFLKNPWEAFLSRFQGLNALNHLLKEWQDGSHNSLACTHKPLREPS